MLRASFSHLCAAPCSMHPCISYVCCAMLCASMRHPCAAPCCVHPCVTCVLRHAACILASPVCCAMQRASLRHLSATPYCVLLAAAGTSCTAFNVAGVPIAAPRLGTGPGKRDKEKKKKELNRFDAHSARGITNKHTNCPPYNVHPTQSTTKFYSVSRHTDARNNSVVVAVVNILHIC
jgi:hypothetical protein